VHAVRWRKVSRFSVAALVLAGLAFMSVAGSGEQPRTWLGSFDVAAAVAAQELPAPVCTPGVLTPAQTAGPFYKSGTPERTALFEPGMSGTRLLLSGYVLNGECQPIPGAWLDFWQADANGQYDNAGYGLRGHQYTDAAGRYTLDTVIPAEYPGRTAHIHVKVQPPGGTVLTSQLYFPDARRNATDGIFDAALMVSMQPSADSTLGTFDFVVPMPGSAD
jgi:protocatechuate 3,4-dioxygenase beta subunit